MFLLADRGLDGVLRGFVVFLRFLGRRFRYGSPLRRAAITAYLVACLLTSLRGPPRAPISLVAVALVSASVGRGATFILSRVANLLAPPVVGGTFARSRVGGRGIRSGPFQASRPAAS